MTCVFNKITSFQSTVHAIWPLTTRRTVVMKASANTNVSQEGVVGTRLEPGRIYVITREVSEKIWSWWRAEHNCWQNCPTG